MLPLRTKKTLPEIIAAAYRVETGEELKNPEQYAKTGDMGSFHIREVNGIDLNLPGLVLIDNIKLYIHDGWMGHSIVQRTLLIDAIEATMRNPK